MGSLQEDYKMSPAEEALLRVNEINGRIGLPMVIKTAIELDLFETMAKTPGGQFSCFDLASTLPKQNTQTPALLERILRYLASESVLTLTVVRDESGESKKLYGMTPLSNYYVRNPDGTSHASSLLLIYDKVLIDCWYNLKDAVVEGGIPFNMTHGVHAFEYPAKDNRFNEVFNKCMYDNTSIVMKMILEKYNGFEGAQELIDVGGGLGANLELIVSKYPLIKGINYDLPHVIKDAPPYQGVEHVGGDMFHSVPKGDVIFMKWILHDWGDNYCIKLLKNCWAALPDNGKVVVVEAVVPEPKSGGATDGVSKNAIGSDMIMLIANPGGKERTMKEFNVLAKESGYSLKDVVVEGGIPFNMTHGGHAFEYPAKDNRFNEVFNKCMYDNTRIVMKMILEKYKGFEGTREWIDVGGGLVANLELIVSMFLHIKGINYDLPHVIKGTKWILHDWGDNYCIKLLKNYWEALPKSGKVVVVVEDIMPEPKSGGVTKANVLVTGDFDMAEIMLS